jgi:hypothetical protein
MAIGTKPSSSSNSSPYTKPGSNSSDEPKMEGVNNKIKTLTRQAYGYRDEAFFILKLLALHQARIKLVG